MFSDNQQISFRQLQILIILDLLGTTIITLPRRTVEYANQDGWIIVIGLVILLVVYSFILSTLGDMFKGQTIIEFGRNLLPKFLYYIIILGLILKILVATAMELRVFSEIVHENLLYNTPMEVLTLSLLLVASYIARKGIEARARLGEILIVLMFIPLFFILIVAVMQPNFDNLLPAFKTPPKDILRGIGNLSFHFNGLEFLLLVYPFLRNKNNSKKPICEAIIVLGVLMVIITVITIAYFGPDDVENQIWPVLQLVQGIRLTSVFMQNQDALIISFWILSVFMFIGAGLNFTSIIFSRLTKSDSSFHFVLPLIPVLYVLSLLPQNIVETYMIIDWFQKYFGIAYLFVIPLILIIIAKMKRGNKYEK